MSRPTTHLVGFLLLTFTSLPNLFGQQEIVRQEISPKSFCASSQFQRACQALQHAFLNDALVPNRTELSSLIGNSIPKELDLLLGSVQAVQTGNAVPPGTAQPESFLRSKISSLSRELSPETNHLPGDAVIGRYIERLRLHTARQGINRQQTERVRERLRKTEAYFRPDSGKNHVTFAGNAAWRSPEALDRERIAAATAARVKHADAGIKDRIFFRVGPEQYREKANLVRDDLVRLRDERNQACASSQPGYRCTANTLTQGYRYFVLAVNRCGEQFADPNSGYLAKWRCAYEMTLVGSLHAGVNQVLEDPRAASAWVGAALVVLPFGLGKGAREGRAIAREAKVAARVVKLDKAAQLLGGPVRPSRLEKGMVVAVEWQEAGGARYVNGQIVDIAGKEVTIRSGDSVQRVQRTQIYKPVKVQAQSPQGGGSGIPPPPYEISPGMTVGVVSSDGSLVDATIEQLRDGVATVKYSVGGQTVRQEMPIHELLDPLAASKGRHPSAKSRAEEATQLPGKAIAKDAEQLLDFVHGNGGKAHLVEVQDGLIVVIDEIPTKLFKPVPHGVFYRVFEHPDLARIHHEIRSKGGLLVLDPAMGKGKQWGTAGSFRPTAIPSERAKFYVALKTDASIDTVEHELQHVYDWLLDRVDPTLIAGGQRKPQILERVAKLVNHYSTEQTAGFRERELSKILKAGTIRVLDREIYLTRNQLHLGAIRTIADPGNPAHILLSLRAGLKVIIPIQAGMVGAIGYYQIYQLLRQNGIFGAFKVVPKDERSASRRRDGR